MNDYFLGAIAQHQERGKRLLERIPPDLPREFHALIQKCNDDLSRLLDRLKLLLQDDLMLEPDYQAERLREFRRVVEYMSFLETTAIAALERHNKDDVFLNRLIEHIRTEIHYPLLPPVVTTLSQQYFHIYTNLNLLFVPLSEGDFLLHLPDLYHELAHPLVTERYQPRVKPFQKALSKGLDIVLGYLAEEQQKEERRRGPQRIGFYLYLWQRSWLEWMPEFFCDLYAIYTVGPAFAWSHIYLCAKDLQNPFRVPTMSTLSHPANDARMKAMLYGLRLIGFTQEANAIELKWEELIETSEAEPEPEYRRCFPDSILRQLAEIALLGVKDIEGQIANPQTNLPIYSLLNEAWVQFWRNPRGYISWERKVVQKLRSGQPELTSQILNHISVW